MIWVVLALCLTAPLPKASEAEVSAWLKALHAEESSFGARVGRVARAFAGTPYADGPLGEGPSGKYDQDPLIDLAHVDCVTFVEQTIALASAAEYQQAFELLHRIRYRDGKIDYETRNHFFISDWLENNAWCRDISQTLSVPTTALTRTISRKDFFELVKAPELGKTTPDRSVTIHYVPVSEAADAVPHLPKPALIVFIGKKPEWLFALHTGLYVPDDSGAGRLFHASSKAEKVTDTDLVTYLQDNATRYLGFTAYEINDPGAPR